MEEEEEDGGAGDAAGQEATSAPAAGAAQGAPGSDGVRMQARAITDIGAQLRCPLRKMQPLRRSCPLAAQPRFRDALPALARMHRMAGALSQETVLSARSVVSRRVHHEMLLRHSS